MKAALLVPILAILAVACAEASRPVSQTTASKAVVTPREKERTTPSVNADDETPAPSSPLIPLLHPRSGAVWLGVELRARTEGEAGIEVLHVFRGSPADGKILPGDVVLSLEGTQLLAPPDLSRALRERAPGEKVGVVLLREGTRRLLTVDLEGLPDAEDRARLEWVGRSAPEIASVVTFQGESASLQELQGKVILLEFWGRYCGACRMLAPQLDDWHRTLSPAGLRVIGITTDTPAEGAEAAGEAHMSYSLVSDLHGDVVRKYHASQIPMLVVLDRRGVVRDVVIGYNTPRLRETEKLLDTLLQERIAPVETN